MTKHDRNIIELCVGVVSDRLKHEKRLKQRYNLQTTLAKLQDILKEPETEQENTGEHYKTFDLYKAMPYDKSV